MARLALLLIATLGSVPALAGEVQLDAAEIMARVAENQDRAVELRKAFVYHQKARVRLLKTNGKLLWDETREYNAVPNPDGTEFEMTRRYGDRRKSGDLRSFDLLEGLDADGLDAELVDSFHDDLTVEDRSRDGVSPHLFPLTTKEQKGYRFTVEGEEVYRRREVYRLRFEPSKDEDFGDKIWKGEVLVDKNEFQPVFFATQMALKIPLAVRVLFGISIRQIGFSVSYERFGENVWFPVSYGGEFFLKLFHFYKRNIIVSSVNEDFRRAIVGSAVRFEESEGAEK